MRYKLILDTALSENSEMTTQNIPDELREEDCAENVAADSWDEEQDHRVHNAVRLFDGGAYEIQGEHVNDVVNDPGVEE